MTPPQATQPLRPLIVFGTRPEAIKLCPVILECQRRAGGISPSMTDSGGVQEEAPSLGCAVLVTREKTERPEAVEAGLAELVGTDRERIVRRVGEELSRRRGEGGMHIADNPYGDGKSSGRIVDWMLETWSDQLT